MLVTAVGLFKLHNRDDKWRTLVHGSRAFTCPSFMALKLDLALDTFLE